MSEILRVYLIRHGETEWSRVGRHTGITDLPLTLAGESAAAALSERLAGISFTSVISSPKIRTLSTCALALPTVVPKVDTDLAEWDYGEYEGLRTSDIRALHQGWNLWEDGCPSGETPLQVALRANRLLDRVQRLSGCVALFTHGHFGRLLAVQWIGAPTAYGRRLLIDPASLSILTFDGETPAIRVIGLWNELPSSVV